MPRNKYGNIPVVIDGVRFASRHEGDVYNNLKLLRAAGQVKEFELQRPFAIEYGEVKICKYISDFLVWWADGRVEVWDAKSAATKKNAVYKLKKKLVKAFHGIDIMEV